MGKMKESLLNLAVFHSNSSKVICNKSVLNKTKTERRILTVGTWIDVRYCYLYYHY